MIDYDYKFDDDVVEFFNIIEYLGGGSIVNFIRGLMYYGQGGGGEIIVENVVMNLGGLLKIICDKRKGGYIIRSGVLKDLSLVFIILVGENFFIVFFLVEIKFVKVIGIVMENDGIVFKLGIQFDERMKRNVGLKQLINLKFVKSNLSLIVEFFWENVIIEVNVFFVIMFCNIISMFVVVSY